MITYFKRTPWWIQKLYPSLIWKIAPKANQVYLTFDDGPHPTITPFVLEELKKYNATATFFCVGDNIAKYPETFEAIINAGHQVANHTYHHVNGWKTRIKTYLREYTQTEQLTQSRLFRPPYGRITPTQVAKIATKAQIIMWNRLSGDFNKSISPETCLQNVIGNGLNVGDIVLFHDSEKALERMQYALPRTLDYIYQNGLTAEKITHELL